MKAVIPAAGLGTRFLPYTKAQPKEMLPIVDKPVLQYVIEEAVAAGANEILVVTGRGKRAIEDYFDSSPELEAYLTNAGREHEASQVRSIGQGARIFYVRQREPRGLGHAILCAKEFVGSDSFAVLLGDDLCIASEPAIGQLIGEHKRAGLSVIGIQEVAPHLTRLYGIATVSEFDGTIGRVDSITEKPAPGFAQSRFACIGRYILPSRIFAILERSSRREKEVGLTPAINELASDGGVLARVYRGTRFDIGLKSEWIRANVEIALSRPDLRDEVRQVLGTIQTEEGEGARR